MPIVSIEMIKGRSREEKARVMEAVHSSLVEAFGIPANDRTLRIVEHDKEDFAHPPHRTDGFTIVSISAFSGRGAEAKRRLYRLVADRVSQALGLDPTDVFIVLHEVPKENWGIRGGISASDVDLGYTVEV
jgi:4-oxalocrotonate tautomerase family enzyme